MFKGELCKSYCVICSSSLQLSHPIPLNGVFVFVAHLTSCRNYCRSASGSTQHRVYFHTVSHFSFGIAHLTLNVLPLGSCRHTLAQERSRVTFLLLFFKCHFWDPFLLSSLNSAERAQHDFKLAVNTKPVLPIYNRREPDVFL